MGTKIYVQIYCDRCGCVGDDANWGQTKYVRKNLKKDGWKQIGGELVCPKCQGLLRGRVTKDTILLRG